MADRYYIDQTSKDVLDGERSAIVDLRRPVSRTQSLLRQTMVQGDTSTVLGLAVISDAGADSAHWKWQFALRTAADGTVAQGNYGSDEAGELVIADAGAGRKGMWGILFRQPSDDDAAADGGPKLVLVPVGKEVVSGLITSNTAIVGQYNGKSRLPGTTTAAALGGVSSTEDCIVWDLAEAGLTGAGHGVTDTPNATAFALGFAGVVVGYDDSTPAKKIVEGTIYFVQCDAVPDDDEGSWD